MCGKLPNVGSRQPVVYRWCFSQLLSPNESGQLEVMLFSPLFKLPSFLTQSRSRRWSSLPESIGCIPVKLFILFLDLLLHRQTSILRSCLWHCKWLMTFCMLSSGFRKNGELHNPSDQGNEIKNLSGNHFARWQSRSQSQGRKLLIQWLLFTESFLIWDYDPIFRVKKEQNRMNASCEKKKGGFIYAFLTQVPLRNAGFQTKTNILKQKSILTRTTSDSYAYKGWKALLCILSVWALGCLKEALLKNDSAYKTKQNKNTPLTTFPIWKSIWILQNSVEQD